MLPRAVSQQAGPTTRRGASSPPHRPGHTATPSEGDTHSGASPAWTLPSFPHGQGPGSPCSKALPTEEGLQGLQGLQGPNDSSDRAPGSLLLRGGWKRGQLAWVQTVAPERRWVGRSQMQTQETISCKWSAKTAWKPTCLTDPDVVDTAQRGCCPHVRPESPQTPLHLQNGASRPHAPAHRARGHDTGKAGTRNRQRYCSRALVGRK